ncbi:hypothetical protein C9374_010464 [Naegleria lovaniensis]|uniref:Uncharacterized protein n=1 Tax=Naegleria lovaniensis TaxID=51637 RepID=A0AA88KDH4_NAELO|nr:uncharacterized protein C9374_010464 [Naegleria lovaniensis]KAG2374720.1 hypothetical protein C9374_010464 [Naegleria lovaniensis]
MAAQNANGSMSNDDSFDVVITDKSTSTALSPNLENASSLDSALMAPTTANATVRTRRSAGTTKKSSVFQLVKTKNSSSNNPSTTSTSGVLTSSSSIMNGTKHSDDSNSFHNVNLQGETETNSVDMMTDLEKQPIVLPKIDLNRNMDLFPNPKSSSESVNNFSRNSSMVEESPIREDSEKKQMRKRIIFQLRRIIHQIRLWWSIKAVRYACMAVTTMIALFFIMTLLGISFGGNKSSTILTPNIDKTAPATPTEEKSVTWMETLASFFSSQSAEPPQPEEQILTLSPDQYKTSIEQYLSKSKPIIMKKFSSKWIASSTWSKEFITNQEFEKRLKRLKKDLAKWTKKKKISLSIAPLDALSRSFYRLPFIASMKEYEFEYDFPQNLDQFANFKKVFSEIWFTKRTKKGSPFNFGRNENINKFMICIIDSDSQIKVSLTSPQKELTDTEVKKTDCIFIPSGWSFQFNDVTNGKFVTWIFE